MGSVLIDPNSPNNGIPWTQLERTLSVCKRLDVIMNFPATAMKRIKGSMDRTGHAMGGYVSLGDAMRRLKKQYWLIRKPRGAHQFTIIVGRNTEWNDHKALEFFDIRSQVGRELFAKATLTEDELKAFPLQQTLFTV